MQILENETQGLFLGELADELIEDLESARLDRLAVELADPLGGVGLEGQPEEAGEERISLLGVLAEEVRELSLQLETDAGLGG